MKTRQLHPAPACRMPRRRMNRRFNGVAKPPYSANCAGRRHWHRTVSGHRPGDSNGGASCFVGLWRCRDYRFSHYAPVGRNGRGRASFRLVCPLRLEILGPFAGFLSGWNYWVMFVLVGMAELTAAGIYMQYWLPDVPTWVWAAAFLLSLMP